MSVEVLDGSTILNFIEDENAFNSSIEARFASLDSDCNGRLTYSELAKELGLFDQSNRDRDGTVDLEEFKIKMREVMLAVASGLGSVPVQMVIEEGSFLKRAIERELKISNMSF